MATKTTPPPPARPAPAAPKPRTTEEWVEIERAKIERTNASSPTRSDPVAFRDDVLLNIETLLIEPKPEDAAARTQAVLSACDAAAVAMTRHALTDSTKNIVRVLL